MWVRLLEVPQLRGELTVQIQPRQHHQGSNLCWEGLVITQGSMIFSLLHPHLGSGGTLGLSHPGCKAGKGSTLAAEEMRCAPAKGSAKRVLGSAVTRGDPQGCGQGHCFWVLFMAGSSDTISWLLGIPPVV